MKISKNWMMIVATVFISALMVLTGCGRKRSDENMAEKMTEKIIKETTGKDVAVKLKEGKVKIEGKDLKTEIAETEEWPADMPQDVPQFTFGKIERVIKTQESEAGMRKFNVWFIHLEEDAANKYANVLRRNGWQAYVTQMGGQGGMISAQKRNLGLNFFYSLERKDGNLSVFTTPK